MEVEVIDDADKSVRHQADSCHRNRPLKGGQEKTEVHVVGHRHDAYTQMTPRAYIGRRGEAGRSEDVPVKKMEMNLGSGFLFYFPLFPHNWPYSADKYDVPCFGYFTPQPLTW